MQMQTPKASTKTSSEGSRKISPRSISSDTNQRSLNRTARQLKTTGLESNSSSPNKPTIRTPKSTSPVIVARRSPKSPISEKKRPGRVAELEAQISQLQDDLKTVKDQLVSSESWKDQAKQDAEESRKQLLAMSSRLEESQKLVARSSSVETHGLQDLEKLDETRISKLEAAKKLHSADLDSLAKAINEINQLQTKLNGKANSEATQTKESESAITELHNLKESMAKTLSLVDSLKLELQHCKISESKAQELARESLLQLETAKKTISSLELDQSKRDNKAIKDLKCEEGKMKCENEEELRERMEMTRVTMSELKKLKEEIEELKANLMDKETELQGICEENEELNLKLKSLNSGKSESEMENEIEKLKYDFDFLKSKAVVTETELNEKSDENEKLKSEIKKIRKLNSNDLVVGGSEGESVVKIDELVEEIESSNRKIVRVAAELEAVRVANGEMEADLRKMKVQSDQWRKAAEAAAGMISAGNNVNRKLVVRTVSMGNCSPRGENIGSPYDVDDDELLKKKTGSVLKRIGVFWKKPQNKRP